MEKEHSIFVHFHFKLSMLIRNRLKTCHFDVYSSQRSQIFPFDPSTHYRVLKVFVVIHPQ